MSPAAENPVVAYLRAIRATVDRLPDDKDAMQEAKSLPGRADKRDRWAPVPTSMTEVILRLT